MTSQTFVLFRIEKLPRSGEFETPHRKPPGWKGYVPDPIYTRINLASGRTGGYQRAEVTHRRRVRIEGTWNKKRVHEIVEERRFSVYYSNSSGLFVAQAQNMVAHGAVTRLNKEVPKEFRLNSVRLALDRIRAHASNILGVWFARTKDNAYIRREGAYGQAIDRAKEFDDMTRRGELTSLTAVIRFERKDIEARISRSGSLSFVKTYSPATCLGFAEYLSNFEATVALKKPSNSKKPVQRVSAHGG